MPFDAHKNLAFGTVAVAPSPALTGTSLTVGSGHGARFPAPPFNATIWPGTALPDPLNAEIVRVNSIATDTFSVVRVQESTSPRTVLTGDFIAATITAKTAADIENVAFRTATWGIAQGIYAAVGTNVANELVVPTSGTVFKAWARAKTPPSGSSLILDVRNNGTSIFTDPYRLVIADNGTMAVTTTFGRPGIAEGDVLTLDVDQVGSLTPGRDIIVQLSYR